MQLQHLRPVGVLHLFRWRLGRAGAAANLYAATATLYERRHVALLADQGSKRQQLTQAVSGGRQRGRSLAFKRQQQLCAVGLVRHLKDDTRRRRVVRNEEKTHAGTQGFRSSMQNSGS